MKKPCHGSMATSLGLFLALALALAAVSAESSTDGGVDASNRVRVVKPLSSGSLVYGGWTVSRKRAQSSSPMVFYVELRSALVLAPSALSSSLGAIDAPSPKIENMPRIYLFWISFNYD